MRKHFGINLFCILCIVVVTSSLLAKTRIKKQRAEFDSSKTIQVKFGSSSWNNDPASIDSGIVILRDANSKKTMQVLLEETAPDSGVFAGTYSITWGGSSIKPEVYTSDKKELMSEADLKKILDDIEDGRLKRKPLFYKKNKTGMQILEVFENSRLAKEALNMLREQNKKSATVDLSSVTSKDYAAAKAIMDSQELAEFAAENEARRREVQKRFIDRFRLEQTEKRRIQRYKKEQAELDEVTRNKRIFEAEQFGQAGLDFYKVNQFDKAEENFRKSFKLNPSQIKYYFQYGMSLYKNEKYNASAIVFNLSKEAKQFEKESLYYLGLSQYAMKEYEPAYVSFSELEKTKDEKLAPLASFYLGLIFYDQKAYEKAKVEFQDVLDTSKDPKLDVRAEAYIDNINQALQFANIKQKKVFLDASLGALYDSNVLQQSTSSADQGTATEEKSLRYILGLGAFYRPIYTKAYEFGAKVRTDYIYTQNEDATDYDPWSIQANLPFVYKTALFGKSFKLELKPGYELLYLGQEATTGDPKKTLKGYYLDVGNTFIMKDSWFTTFTLSFRNDDFFETTDQGKNANKITFKWTNMIFTNKTNTKGFLTDLAYSTSSAQDATNDYTRYDLSALYLTPVFNDKATFAGGLATYILDYKSRNKDFNKTINLTLTKPIHELVSATLLGTYVINDSDSQSYEYDKWTLGFVFTANYGF